MLRLEQRVLPLQLLEASALLFEPRRHHGLGPASQSPIPQILPPLRQHERVDLERARHGLHLEPRLLAELHRRDFELCTVLLNLPRPRPRHRHLPVVREKCLQNRVTFPGQVQLLVRSRDAEAGASTTRRNAANSPEGSQSTTHPARTTAEVPGSTGAICAHVGAANPTSTRVPLANSKCRAQSAPYETSLHSGRTSSPAGHAICLGQSPAR